MENSNKKTNFNLFQKHRFDGNFCFSKFIKELSTIYKHALSYLYLNNKELEIIFANIRV